jgi:hypothetical protein
VFESRLGRTFRNARVFYVFDRLIRSKRPLDGLLGSAKYQLFRKPPVDEGVWLPVVKNYGEGIYLELQEDAINSWLDDQSEWLQKRLDADFVANKATCHACVLLPETSCEAMNNGLDRAMLVGEPEHPEKGFLSRLLNYVPLIKDY